MQRLPSRLPQWNSWPQGYVARVEEDRAICSERHNCRASQNLTLTGVKVPQGKTLASVTTDEYLIQIRHGVVFEKTGLVPFLMILQAETLAPALRAGRNALGWSQKELSEKSGVSVPTIARTEISNNPTMAIVHALLVTFEMNGIVFTFKADGFEMAVNFLQK
jgi:DNA-binding XRE family transcriptional regulator